MIKFSVDETIKQINLFDERFYQIEDKDIFNVTGWLEAFPKGYQFKQWLMNTKDPDAVRDEAAQLGSEVHRLIELTLLGDTVKWLQGQMKLEVWERYLCWCNFWKDLQESPNKVLDIKKKIKKVETIEKFTEFITYSLEYNTAGTVDKMIKIIYEDDTFQFIIFDWKSGNNIYDTSYIQVATYAVLVMTQYNISDLLAYIIQVKNQLNKKGYRVNKVENITEEFGIFLATQKLYIRAFGEPKPKYKSYPMEVDLNYIYNEQIIKDGNKLTEKKEREK